MTVAPRRRELFSAVWGLKGWVWGCEGCDRATKGSLNLPMVVLPQLFLSEM